MNRDPGREGDTSAGPWARAPAQTAPRMGFRTAIRTCFRKYVTFSGRASRPEFWWFFLFVQLGAIVAGVIDGILFDVPEDGQGDQGAPLGLVGAVFNLATFLPLVAAGWRRMHDSGRSGLHLIYPVIVMVGIGMFAAFAVGIPEGGVQDASMIVLVFAGIVFLISPFLVIWWLTRPSDPNPNRYGPPPAEVTP